MKWVGRTFLIPRNIKLEVLQKLKAGDAGVIARVTDFKNKYGPKEKAILQELGPHIVPITIKAIRVAESKIAPTENDLNNILTNG